MKYAQRITGGTRTSSQGWGYARGAALAILTTAALTGCVGRWFERQPQANDTQSSTPSPGDLKGPAVTYIQGLCALPREQREPQVRELNEALLPNHVTISCGRGGGGAPQGQ
jgi:hypothetical protein